MFGRPAGPSYFGIDSPVKQMQRFRRHIHHGLSLNRKMIEMHSPVLKGKPIPRPIAKNDPQIRIENVDDRAVGLKIADGKSYPAELGVQIRRM